MFLIEQILAWANDQHKWQQKAVRLLLAKENLSEEDIQELVKLCKTEHGAADDAEAAEVLPLTIETVTAPKASGQVTLRGISGITNVNALMQDAKITFGESLTIVYGENASGKSGFCRLLKNICRARHPEAVLPNVLSGSTDAPSATVHFAFDDVEQSPLAWKKDDAPSLLSVSVFDSKCATAYVEDENDVAYRPMGLDVFDRLAAVCGRMGQVMQKESEALEAALEDFSDLTDGTEVGKLLAALSAKTKPDDVLKLATLSEDDLKNVERLKKEIARLTEQDPQKKSRQLTAQKGRVMRLASHLGGLATVFAPEKIEKLRQLKTDAEIAKGAAKLASEEAFKGALPGVGESVWKKLWQAAREYSAHVYPDQKFPVTGKDAVCVTCQQPVSEEAAKRMLSFEAFVQMEAQRASVKATEDYEEAKRAIVSTKVCPADWENISEEMEPEMVALLETFLTSAWQRKVCILGALGTADWDSLPALPSSLEVPLQKIVEAAGEEIEGLKPAKPEELATANVELAELVARQQLQKKQVKVIRKIAGLAEIQKLRACVKKTATNSISNQSTKMTKDAITQPFYERFQKELEAIGLPIGAEFVHVGSKKGMPYHRIILKGHGDVPIKLEAVTSESEYRSLALAGFLTELATESHASAIIFDDPVSSLDHVRRDIIAKRIATESLQRQVIVFTHDLVFVRDLEEAAEKLNIEPTYRHITGGKKGFGICYDELRWSTKSVKKRVSQLRDKHIKAKVAFDNDEHENYETLGTEIYGLLREAWERAIEEVLFGGVMERFKGTIETQKLSDVDVLPGDYQVIEENMAKCSRLLTGHHKALAINKPFPEQGELLADVLALETWVAALRERRKKTLVAQTVQ